MNPVNIPPMPPSPSGPSSANTLPAPLDGHSLLEQLGREVAGSLSPALDRVTTLSDSGRIDRSSLRALRDEIGRARHAGIVGQQLARLAQGRVALMPERVDLTALLREAVAQRGRDMDVRGIEVRQSLAAADVVSDATLLFALLQAALDWSFEHAAGRIALRLELRDQPAHARVRSAFAYRMVDDAESSSPTSAAGNNMAPTAGPPPRQGATLDTVSWRLVEQTALVLGLSLRRRDARGSTELVLDFPPAPAPTSAQTPAPAPAPQSGALASTAATETLAPTNPAATAAGPAATTAASGPAQPPAAGRNDRQRTVHAQPLAGQHVLVLAAQRELRLQVREALGDMDLLVDFVTSVDEARLFCADALPHALVYEAAEATNDFVRLRDSLLLQRPSMGLVQITDGGAAFDVLSLGRRDFVSIGSDGLEDALPAALTFELFRDN